jgi:hypothetical protein
MNEDRVREIVREEMQNNVEQLLKEQKNTLKQVVEEQTLEGLNTVDWDGGVSGPDAYALVYKLNARQKQEAEVAARRNNRIETPGDDWDEIHNYCANGIEEVMREVVQDRELVNVP